MVITTSMERITSLPRHVAFIMDGNGRWAGQHGLPRLAGHWEGATNAHRVAEILFDRRVKYVTLYVFSTENWNRPTEEVEGIFQILMARIDEEVEFAQRKKIRICHLGRLEGLPLGLRNKIKQAVELTKGNQAMTVSLAFNYGSRDEILGAVQRLLLDGISAGNVDEALFRRYLYTAGMPDPDLIIRTGGEMRLSNFLLWQAAYAEFYSTPVLWPDFDCDEVDKAFIVYRERQRRFGSVTPAD